MTKGPHPPPFYLPRWRVLLPAAVLFTIALLQIGLAKMAYLSPWKGGGFGMFSSIEIRTTRIFVLSESGDEELNIAPSQEILAARARQFPSDSNLLELAVAVAAREKTYGRNPHTVRIEVWRSEFNEYLRADDRPIRTLVWNVDESLYNSR
jgi:hypothetical protein